MNDLSSKPGVRTVAERLVKLYEVPFGGKQRGRFRISMKVMRALTGRKRVSEAMVREISAEVFELGYVLVDLDGYFVVLAQRTFRGYRRVSDAICSSGRQAPIKERNL